MTAPRNVPVAAITDTSKVRPAASWSHRTTPFTRRCGRCTPICVSATRAHQIQVSTSATTSAPWRAHRHGRPSLHGPDTPSAQRRGATAPCAPPPHARRADPAHQQRRQIRTRTRASKNQGATTGWAPAGARYEAGIPRRRRETRRRNRTCADGYAPGRRLGMPASYGSPHRVVPSMHCPREFEQRLSQIFVP